jgi:hypothetical protein
MNQGSIRARGKRFLSLRRSVKTSSGAHPVSFRMTTLSPVVKWPEREAKPSLAFSAEFKNVWSYTSTPPYFFAAGA